MFSMSPTHPDFALRTESNPAIYTKVIESIIACLHECWFKSVCYPVAEHVVACWLQGCAK